MVDGSSEVVTLKGRVAAGSFGTGSKSERQALYLVTPDRRYVLRRPGANPFQDDPALRRLEGEEIECSGRIVGDYTLLVDSFRSLR